MSYTNNVFLKYRCGKCDAEIGAACVTVDGVRPGTPTLTHTDRVIQHSRKQFHATQEEVDEAIASIIESWVKVPNGVAHGKTDGRSE